MIQGERVVLRAIRRADLSRLSDLFDDDLEMSGLVSVRPPRPTTLEEMEARFDLEQRDPPTDHVRFAIEAGGEVIGECSLHGIDHYRGVAEVGIAIGRAYWGQGFGQDAVRTIVGFGFRNMNLRRIGLEVLADDPRAVTAYRRAGFIEEGRLRQRDWVDGDYHDVLVMSIMRDEWKGKE